jgi:hypothetical protein
MITLIMRVASPHNARDRAVITTAAISKHEAHIDGGGTLPGTPMRAGRMVGGVQREGDTIRIP